MDTFKLMKHIYFGEPIVFSTAHQKDKILEADFQNALQIKFVVPKGLDTDQFGTFTGEIERADDLKAVLKSKALLGTPTNGISLYLSSEGSFGPDPVNPFLFCNQENLLILDLKNNIEIFASKQSYDTSFNFASLKNKFELDAFLKKNPADQQPLVLKDSKNSKDRSLIFKGISDDKEAAKIFDHLISTRSSVWIESDLRAHMNKKRQKVIKDCGQKLLEKILSLCPKCSLPGFSITKGFGHLKCVICDLESNYPSHDIWSCADQNCKYEKHELRSDGIQEIEPKYCMYCNP